MQRNSFSTHFLNKASTERADEKWINLQLHKNATKIIPVWQTKTLCKSGNLQQPVYALVKDFEKYASADDRYVFLGLVEDVAYFAFNIDSEDKASRLCGKYDSDFFEFRQVAPLLSYIDCAMLSLARFMVQWNSRNTFCGKCGHKTNPIEGGNARICTNESCKENFYPSMDPAVIVLVTSGDKCLLGRQSRWPEGMYSTIAGFVEPGESIEDATYREVDEETGIRISNLKYQSSQPWLFPGSLMLGFYAQAINTNIEFDKNELEDAKWFTREEIKENLDKGLMKLPLKVSIAYRLIKNWFDEGNMGELDEQ